MRMELCPLSSLPGRGHINHDVFSCRPPTLHVKTLGNQGTENGIALTEAVHRPR